MSDQSAYASAEMASTLRDEPDEHIREWAGLVDDKETLDMLNHLENTMSRPVLETELGKRILASAATETADEAARAGNVSQMKQATGLTNQTENKDRFFVEVADRLSYEGSVGLVFGSPGSGKTSLVLDTAQVWKAVTGGRVVANIDWNGADAHFSSDKEMLEAMASYEGPVLAVLDEVAQELSGFGSGSKKAEAFSDSLLFIRKREQKHGSYAKKGSVLSVAHTRTKTAKSIRRVASFAVEKPQKSRPDRARILESEGGKDEWSEVSEYQGITDTAEDYDQYEASTFTVSEDYEGDESDESKERDNKIRRALELHLGDGWTQKQAGKAVDMSSAWVSNRVTEFRNDELEINIDLSETEGQKADD